MTFTDKHFVDTAVVCGGGGGVGGGIDSCCGGEEDSSYDSDCEAPEAGVHDDVSRTVSDTLGAEFAEYVTTLNSAAPPPPPPPGYTQRVEFGLKLGYTERQVQAALAKLGPSPGQNELLAELIKLGASRMPNSDFSPTAEALPPLMVSSSCLVSEDERLEDLDLEESPGGQQQQQFRHIVIDGSNVAMSHGNKDTFSCRGIKLCVDWFRLRGHKDITVFVPRWRKEASRPERPINDQEILLELERERLLVFTPSRHVGGKRVMCYDDRYILKLAAETDGVVVSNDNYRDLISQCPEFRRVVEERILMYSFVNDKFMPPDDPLGRSGPTLDNFLRMHPVRPEPPRPCPYGKKCTYGNKCKYHHPERGLLPQKSVSERLMENAQRQLQARSLGSRDSSPGDQLKGKSLSLPLSSGEDIRQPRKTPLSRTKSSAPAPSTLPEDETCKGVSKSRSVENVAAPPPGYGYRLPPPTSYGNSQQQQQQQQLWAHCMVGPSEWQQYSMYRDQGGHVAVAKQLSDPVTTSDPSEQPANLHRKLQRQLTLNPNYDPRLYHLQQGYQPQPQYQDHHSVSRHNTTGSMPLGGGGGPQGPPPSHSSGGWDRLSSDPLHQSVTRIASAPDAFPRWPPSPAPQPQQRHMQRLSSCSDPQLNLYSVDGNLMPEACESGPWQTTHQSAIPPQNTWHRPPQPQQFDIEAVRSKMNYHLSYIFPSDQVQTIMNMYPEETNPQKICAAILEKFPNPNNISRI